MGVRCVRARFYLGAVLGDLEEVVLASRLFDDGGDNKQKESLQDMGLFEI